MTRGFSADELFELLQALGRPTAMVEAGVVLGCLLAAWAVVRLIRGPARRPGSIWFGNGVIDGVLFPVLALFFVFAARWVLKDQIAPAVFRVALPVLISLLAIRLTVRVLHSAFPSSPLMRVVERSVSWLAWIAVALWISGVLPLVLAELDAIQWKLGSAQISLRNLIEGLLAAVLVLVLALWISATLEARLLKGASADNLSVRKMAANVLRAVLLFVGLVFALSAAGIDLTALSVLGGAFGVGLGFGLQKLAANYVSGFVILAERSVRIGDLVKVDGFEGRITDITTRYTVLRNGNGRESIVPNEMLITQRVENASAGDRLLQVQTAVQVAYGTHLEILAPLLVQAIAAVPRVLAEPPPAVQLQAFGNDGLELQLPFWIRDPENGIGNVRSDVNLAILRTLDAAGIEIPYPQRVVHAGPGFERFAPPAEAA